MTSKPECLASLAGHDCLYPACDCDSQKIHGMSESTGDSFVQFLKDNTKRPDTDQIWQHRNGQRYVVLFVANLPNNDRYPEIVVYYTMGEPHKRWARPLSDWHRSMTFVT